MTQVSTTNIEGDTPRVRTAVEYGERTLFFRHGRLVDLERNLTAHEVFQHSASGTTLQVKAFIDNGFQGWRRDFYRSTNGIGFYLMGLLDNAGLCSTDDRNLKPGLELTVTLIRIRMGAFGTRLPSTVEAHSVLKRKSDGSVVLEFDTEGHGFAPKLSELAAPRAIDSMERSLADAASQIVGQVAKAVLENRAIP